jgi:hypothetical protein
MPASSAATAAISRFSHMIVLPHGRDGMPVQTARKNGERTTRQRILSDPESSLC